MSRGVHTVLRVVLWAGWLLCACPGDGEDVSEARDAAAAGTSASTASSCSPGTLCYKHCISNQDCDRTGGHACVTSTKSSDGQLEPSSSGGDDRSSAVPAIAADADAGPIGSQGQRGHAPLAPGNCAIACATELCTDPHSVCSNAEGTCKKGCDPTRPACDPGQACDFSKKECVPLDGSCRSDNECPIFDKRLSARGSVSCEEQRCRYHPKPPDAVQPLRVAIASSEPLPLNVLAPQAGSRLSPDDASTFQFQFALPAPVLVASVLTRPIDDLSDAENAAVWIAYVDRRDALNGVTLAKGGVIRDGAWQRYAEDEVPTLPNGQLYFFVLGYEQQGKLVATSELVPFSVGEARRQAGAACDDSLYNQFCAQESALICADRVCRMPCVSDDDCPDGRACSEPGALPNIPARLCL